MAAVVMPFEIARVWMASLLSWRSLKLNCLASDLVAIGLVLVVIQGYH